MATFEYRPLTTAEKIVKLQAIVPSTKIHLADLNTEVFGSNQTDDIRQYIITEGGFNEFKEEPFHRLYTAYLLNPNGGASFSYSDDFDRADSTNLGPDWTEQQGDAEILSNELRNVTNNGSVLGTWNTAPTTADYEVIADVKVAASQSGGGPIGRYSDNQNYYHLRINSTDNELQLFSFTTGAGATKIGSYSTTITPSVFFEVGLQISGTTIKGFLNGVERISVTNSDHTDAGEVGFRMFGTASSIVINDWSATSSFFLS